MGNPEFLKSYYKGIYPGLNIPTGVKYQTINKIVRKTNYTIRNNPMHTFTGIKFDPHKNPIYE